MASSLTNSRLSLLLLFSASQLIPKIQAFTQCYYPDGSIPTDYIWQPCTGDKYSSCCIPTEGDICQPSGLCFYPGTNDTFRGTCTDRTWTDAACPNICVAGQEDTWTWATPCSSDNGAHVQYSCGHLDDGSKVTTNCTGSAVTYSPIFLTVATSTTKATRYTAPPSVDPNKFTVYTVTYTTKVTAFAQDTTLTTTWESTFTSAFGQTSDAGGGNTITGINGGFITSTPTPASSAPKSGGITVAPGVLGAAIAGPIVVLALLAGLFFFLRKKRALKKAKGERLPSPSGPGQDPPANGPVGNDQVRPYEVSATETTVFTPDRKYLYTPPPPPPSGPNAGAYEMSSAGEKGWANAHGGGGVAEVSADSYQQQPQHQQWSGTQVPSPISPQQTRSPAPVYSEGAAGPGLMPVELDGGDYPPSRPTTATGRARNGVGNA